MKVLFDHQIYAKQNYGGISRYFFELSSKLPQIGVEVKNSVALSNNDFIKDNIYKAYPFFPKYEFKGKHRIVRYINELVTKKTLQGDFDVFHPTYYDTYFFNLLGQHPLVVTFHDLIHEKFGQRYPLILEKNLLERRKFLLESSQKIIAVSEHTKQDIIEHYKIDEAKVKVIYLANSISISEEGSQLDYGDYILYVGSREYYKNFTFFIDAIAPLIQKRRSLKIICAGGGAFKKNEINTLRSLKLLDNCRQLNINNQNLAALYKKARFFIFPSLYEGFGLPVLEAFSCSCPTLLSNSSSLPEVGSTAALYFDAMEKEDLLYKSELLLDDEDLRQRLIKAGLAQNQNFSWEKTAQAHKEVYTSLI